MILQAISIPDQMTGVVKAVELLIPCCSEALTAGRGESGDPMEFIGEHSISKTEGLEPAHLSATTNGSDTTKHWNDRSRNKTA